MPSENYLFLLILFIWFVFPLKNGKNKQEQYNTGLWSRKDQLGRQEQTPIVLLQVCLNVLYCVCCLLFQEVLIHLHVVMSEICRHTRLREAARH